MKGKRELSGQPGVEMRIRVESLHKSTELILALSPYALICHSATARLSENMKRSKMALGVFQQL